MLGKISRSSSAGSLVEGTTSPAQRTEQLIIQSAMFDQPEPHVAESIKFTQDHPIGAILIKLAQDNTALAKKTNLRGVETNINDLCTSFHAAIQTERADMDNKLHKTHELIESNIINKDLSSHKINCSITPPHYFSSEPTITSTAKLTEVLKIFPRNMKFSGSKQDNHVSIIEFLNTLKTAQEQVKLSEPEFIDRMLACSTGLAHELILEWRNNGENIQTIYHNLLVNFDKRITPEEAKHQLYNLRLSKSTNLAKAEAQIMLLASRVASQLPEGPSRVQYYNLEACNGLIRALPPSSSANVNNLFNKISARLGRVATFAELSRAMNILRSTIDKDIKLNGSESQFRGKNAAGTKNVPRKKYVAYNINAVPAREQKIIAVPYREQKNPPRKTNIGTYHNTSHTPRPININRSAPKRPFMTGPNKSNKRHNPSHKQVPKRGPDGKFLKRQGNTSKSCSLCGLSSHSAQDCRLMLNDSGKKVDIIPTYGVCSKCPQRIQPRLHHPEPLCPYRIGGPLQHRNT